MHRRHFETLRRGASRRHVSPGAVRGLFVLWVLLVLCLVPVFASAAEVIATRVWPAREYTRVTIELDRAITFELGTVAEPPRVVADLSDVALSQVLSSLSSMVGTQDPYISQVRLGRYKPHVTRIVFDLKQEVNAKAFVIEPAGDYRYRLVIDLRPAQPADPLAALLGELDRPPSPTAPEVAPSREDPAPNPPRGKRKKDIKLPRLVTIAIDAGHGGEDPGAKGQLGTYEKDVTLAIARQLKTKIDEQPNMRAVLIRDDDYFIALGERVHRARRLRADLFVSVHADAFVKPHARGSSVFALSEKGATSAAARWLAKRENQADLIGGIDLDVADARVKQVLFDLSQTATLNDSLKLARAVLHELGGVNTLHKQHVEQAGFAVLKAPDIPSILVETAFITNPREERRLRTQSYQIQMAAAIMEGIKRFFATNPPAALSTKIAQKL
ncbi:MAG: N-acetylmuramoyl-L-alanine amidase [Betaproteobacteria bacterium]|nr:N-acetylmuramoyl-L-alanine amidase [Betaproteobacteria bacterium]